jgi:CRISPR-associated exonuclease Cas4
MCLEEMLACDIHEGALFYHQTKRRELVSFTDSLRVSVENMLQEMHGLYARGYTPRAKRTKACNACSLKNLCLPQLSKTRSVRSYIDHFLNEEMN